MIRVAEQIGLWLALLLLCLAPSIAHAQATEEFISYRFKPDDTLLALARKYMVQRESYREVARYNDIRDDRAIPVGFNLKIPYRLLKYRPITATVAAFRGNASIQSGKAVAAAARIGATFGEGATLATGKSSALSIEMQDGSKITMPSNSRVRVARLRKIILTDSIDYEFAIETGGATTRVTPFRKPQDRYRMRTPITVSAVRGTEFRSRYEPETSGAFAELLEGGLALDGPGQATVLKPGFGAIARTSGVRTEKLLPAPTLLTGAGTQREQSLAFAVVPSGEASAYRLQIARDSGFIDIAEDVIGNTAQITTASLDNGNYFARVTAISADGLEGLPATFAFKRRLNSLTAATGRIDEGYAFRWSSDGTGKRLYRFQLFRASSGLPLPENIADLGAALVDEPGLTSDSVVLSDLSPGKYAWRVGTILFVDGEMDETWTPLESFTISPE